MEDALKKAHELSKAVTPYVGSMRVALHTHGDELTVLRIHDEAIICNSRQELDKILDGMLMLLKAIKPEMKKSNSKTNRK